MPGRIRWVRFDWRLRSLYSAMNVYTDAALLDVAGAIEALPRFGTGPVRINTPALAATSGS